MLLLNTKFVEFFFKTRLLLIRVSHFYKTRLLISLISINAYTINCLFCFYMHDPGGIKVSKTTACQAPVWEEKIPGPK